MMRRVIRSALVAVVAISLSDSVASAAPLEKRILRMKLGRTSDNPEMPDWAIEIRVQGEIEAPVTGGTYYVYNERDRRLLAGGVLDAPNGLGHLFARHLFDDQPTDRPGDHVNAVAFLHEKPLPDREVRPLHLETAEVIVPEGARGEELATAAMENEYAMSSVPLRMREGESLAILWRATNGLTGLRIGGGWVFPHGPAATVSVPRLFSDGIFVVASELPDPAFEGTVDLVIDADLVDLFESRGYGYLVVQYRTVIATEDGEPRSDWMHSGWIAIEPDA